MWFNHISKNVSEIIKSKNGYVFIATILFLPILLYGTKLILEREKGYAPQKTQETAYYEVKYFKLCAKEAALAVAKRWNPALTYKQQKASMLRIADNIYNQAPTCSKTSSLTEGIPGISVPSQSTKEDFELSPDQKQVLYETKTTPLMRYSYKDLSVSDNSRFPWFSAYYMHNKYNSKDLSLFTTLELDEDSEKNDECKLFQDFCLTYTGGNPEYTYWQATVPSIVNLSGGSSNISSSSEGSSLTYSERQHPNDDTVQIECFNDTIKVTTDNDVGYAIPATCNVDIVLTIPINAAASNENNRDLNSPTLGIPYASTSSTPNSKSQSTPIYQISRAYQKFVKNFFYTKGVNIGILPYSGNISITSSPATSAYRGSWLKDPDYIDSSYFTNHDNWNSLNYDNKFTPPRLMGAMLYGSSDTLDSTSSTANHKTINLLCRGKTVKTEQGVDLIAGDLLSVENPSGYKFRNQQFSTCYSTYANLLSFKCEGNKKNYYANPYYIVELTPDLLYIYYMLTTFYPYDHDQNQSNFVFIPVTWCNNLFQNWTSTGQNSETNTSFDTAGLGRLSTPSKMINGRKKVLILTVNKPDWFEPGELTYIGFDNDYSDTPAVESDTIRFDINYSDNTRKFADESKYDGTIQGQKKILKFSVQTGSVSYTSGYYQTASATGRLTFPLPYLIKLVVAPKDGKKNTDISSIQFLSISSETGGAPTITQTINEQTTFYILPSQLASNTNLDFVIKNVKLISAEITNHPYSIENNKPNFGKGFKNPERSVYIDMLTMSEEGKFKYEQPAQAVDYLKYGGDLSGNISNVGVKKAEAATPETPETPLLEPSSENWEESSTLPQNEGYNNWNSVAYGNGYFVTAACNSNIAAFITLPDLKENKTKWTINLLPCCDYWVEVTYGGGYFFALSDSDNVAYIYSSDLPRYAWSKLTISFSSHKWHSIASGQGYLVAIALNDNVAAFRDIHINSSSPKATWILMPILDNTARNWTSIAYGGDYFIAITNSNISAYIKPENLNSSLNWNQLNMPIDGCFRIVAGNTTFMAISETTNSVAILYEESIKYHIDWIILDTPFENHCSLFCTKDESAFSAGTLTQNAYYFIITLDGKIGFIKEVDLRSANRNLYWNSLSAKLPTPCHASISGTFGCIVVFSDKENIFSYLFWSKPDQDTEPYSVTKTASVSQGLPSYRGWQSVTYGEGYFVAIAKDSHISAYIKEEDLSEGAIWTTMAMDMINSYQWKSVTYGDGYFVAIANNSHFAAYIHKDNIAEGAIWTKMTLVNATNRPWNSVAYGDGYFIAVAKNCAAYINKDNITYGNPWILINTTPNRDWTSIAYGDGFFVIIASGNYSACIKKENIAANGTWIEMNFFSSVTLYTNNPFNHITFGNGYFVAVEQNQNYALYIHKDDLKSNANWSQSTLIDNTPRNWFSVIYGEGYFVAVSFDSNVAAYIHKDNLTSGEKWKQINLVSEKWWESICYGGYFFVTINNGGAEVGFCDILSDEESPEEEPSLDTTWFFYNNSSKDSTNHHFFMDYPSDMYFATNTDLLDNIKFNLGKTYYEISQTTVNQSGSMVNSTLKDYLGAGTYRITKPLDTMYNDTSLGVYDFKWNVKDLENHKIPLLYAGVTLPINITLYYGMNGSTQHFYEWQSNSSGNITTLEPNKALENVTVDACKKLKNDWGNNIRIYLIMFRTQDQYVNKVTRDEENFDYSYLNNCISNSSYKYNIDSEAELKETLSQIASDIKSWAGMQGAMNV